LNSNSDKHNELLNITDDICRVVEKKPGRYWKYGFAVSFFVFLAGVYGAISIIRTGLGVMDINNFIFWGILITNFVFWIGISHAGTFISAILLLMNQEWRRSINRSAEAMTIIAILIAGLMPIIHLGRPGYFYWLLPFSNRTGYFLINFYSPLSWDFYAILTYLVVSFIFFGLGLMPDFATLRDRTDRKLKWKIYNILSFGWTGSHKAWQDYHKLMYLMAGLITALVISVHSIVSLDFANTLNPGWHSTIFPIYFVTGAIFSGFAMVNIMALIIRKIYNFRHIITNQHIENMNKIILTTGVLMVFFYFIEIIFPLLAKTPYEKSNLFHEITGHYWWIYLIMVLTTLVLPQLFWKKSIRSNGKTSFIISVLIVIGMWLERFVIIVGGFERGFISSGYSSHQPSFTSFLMIIGMVGLFFMLFFLLVRFVTIVSIFEQKIALKKTKESSK
jgi:Ni/Fe-hydrogenase subunit HybB-like protein